MCNTVYAIYIIYVYTHKYCIFIGWPRKSGVLIGILLQISPSWPPVYHSHQSKKRDVCLTAAWGGSVEGFQTFSGWVCVFIQVGFSTDFLSIAGGIRLGCSHITYHRVLLGAMGKSSGCWPFFFQKEGPELDPNTTEFPNEAWRSSQWQVTLYWWYEVTQTTDKFSEFQHPAWICSRPLVFQHLKALVHCCQMSFLLKRPQRNAVCCQSIMQWQPVVCCLPLDRKTFF